MGEEHWRRFVEELLRGRRLDFSEHWSAFQAAYAEADPADGPPIAWWPDDETRERSNLFSLMRELGIERYRELHRWTIAERSAFWERVVSRLGIVFESEPVAILEEGASVENACWFKGARLDVTRSAFAAEPDKPAILFGREPGGEVEATSYRELERQVDRFAAGLRRRGFQPDAAVALYLPMTPECVASYLGTVRAGCRVVSIADSFSADELRARMEIAGASAVVTLSSYRRAGRTISLYPKVREALRALDGDGLAVVLEASELEGDDIAWEDFLSDEPLDEAFAGDPDHVTNVLFSSGTTGVPKAIPWTELTPLKCAMDAHFHQDVHPGDVICWPTNIGWMMGPWLIYASLLNRATMALYEGAPHSKDFVEFVEKASVSVLGVVPSLVRHWRSTDAVGEGDFDGVRLFSSTGEASMAEDYLWLMSRARYRAPVIEYLGGTEIGGGHLSGTVLQPASPSTFTTGTLGTELVILDEEGAPVDEGETGELFLVPPALGLSQRLLNADHHEVYFEGCPRGPNGEVLRRHGDQIKRLPRGFYKAQGRADDTMNLGAIKVSSVELERVVNDHPAVYESAAVGVVEGGEGAEKLVVYVVPAYDVDRESLKTELAAAIAARLNPLFKIHDVVVIESLPRTASNKIMRRRLRSRYADEGSPPSGGVP